MMRFFPDFLTAIRLARRARLLSTLVWITLALVVGVLMAAQFSARQPATVALDVGLSIIRLALPLLIVFQLQELFSREFDRRYFLTSLTYPRSRFAFLTGRFLTVQFIVLASLAFLAALLALLVWQIGESYQQATPVALDHRYLLTHLFIGLDLLVLSAFAMLLSIVAITPSFVLVGTLGFMLISRAYSGIIALLETERYVVADPELYQSSLGVLGYLLPDLGALDIRMISLYSEMAFLPDNWPMLVLGNLTYVLVLLALSLWFLQRKRFN